MYGLSIKREESKTNRVAVQKEPVTTTNPERIKAIVDDYLVKQALRVYIQSTTLGFVTGIRSMSSLALLGWTSDKSLEGLQLPIQLLTTFAAIGEAVADKLPVIPSRTSPAPFIGRLVIGGASGLLLCRREQVPPILGVVTGALGAATGAFVSTYGRTKLSKATKIPDPVLGILEDALVTGLGTLFVRKSR